MTVGGLATAQAPDLDWSSVTTRMKLERTADGAPTLVGPAVERFAAIVRDHRVLMFGEQHYVDGVAETVQVALRQAQAQEDVHLVLENGTWIAARCSARGEDAIAAVRRFPHSFTFDSNGDLDLLRQAATRPHDEFVWGLDQMQNAIHPLDRLVEIAPDSRAARLARGAFLKAALRFGRYSRQDHARDIDALRDAFGDESPEAAGILDELAKTQSIFLAHFAGKRGEISPQVSVTEREEHMAALFDEYLERNRVDGAWPQMVFKMGGAHVLWGVGPNGIETLGQHVRERAQADGVSVCHIGVSANHDPEFPPADTLRAGEITLVDTAAVRALLGEDGLAALSEDARLRLERYDQLLYLEGAGRAHEPEIASYKRKFRQRVTGMVLPLGIPLVILLTGLWPAGRALWRRMRGRANAESGSGAIFAVALCLPALVLAWQLEKILANSDGVPAAIDETWYWITHGLMWAGCAAALVTLLRHGRRGTWTRGLQIHGLVLLIAAVTLVMMMAHCNFGGMLGS